MASSRCGGSTANGGEKLVHSTKPSWYAACKVVSGHAMVGSRSRVDGGALPARWPSRSAVDRCCELYGVMDFGERE